MITGIVGALSVIAAVVFWPELNTKTDTVVTHEAGEPNEELSLSEIGSSVVADGSLIAASSVAEPEVPLNALAGESAVADSEPFLPNPLLDESQFDSDLLTIENEIDALDELVEPALVDGFPLSTTLQPNTQSLPATTPQSTSED